jgi:ketosteroid isomerase-like protein
MEAEARRELGDWAAVTRVARAGKVWEDESRARTAAAGDNSAREVWAVVEAFNRAFAANDPARYFDFVAEEITVLTPGNPYRVEGRADDREEFELGLRAGYSRVEYFQEMQPRVQVYGDTAVATYFSRGRYGPEGAARAAYYKETDVLVRRAAGWKIVHVHVSAV